MLLGVFIALFSAASFALMGLMVRLNHASLPVSEQIFLRAMLSCLLLLPLCWRQIPHIFHKGAGFFLGIRSFAGALSVVCYFQTLYQTTTANANLLYSSAPIFVCIFAYLFEKKFLRGWELLGVILIIGGNVLLYLPQGGGISPDVGLMGTLGAALAGIALYSLGNAAGTFSSSLVVFCFSFCCGVVALLDPMPWVFPLEPFWAPLTMSLAGLLAQLTLTLSFARLNTSIASALGRSSILWGALLEIIFLDAHPRAWEWFSYGLVLAGIFVIQVPLVQKQRSKENPIPTV